MLTKFEYRITGMGWAELELASEQAQTCITISDICDPLEDIIAALTRFRQRVTVFEKIMFRDEPGCTELLLTEIANDVIRIEVFEEAYFEHFQPDDGTGKTPMPVFTTYIDEYALSSWVYSHLSELITTMGIDAYNETWQRPFPEKEFAEWKSLIRY